MLSGSADVGFSNGLLGVIGAYVKGAPVRVISAQMTGAGELYWYARAESGIRSLKDAAGKTVAFSSPGSSSNLILLGAAAPGQVDAKTLAAGGAPATLTQVMTGQIDVGWAAAPFGLQNVLDGKITVIARTTDVPQLANQTIRVNIANRERAQHQTCRDREIHAHLRARHRLGLRKSARHRDLRAEQEAACHRQEGGVEFYPKAGLQIGEIKGLDLTLQDALDYKYIPVPRPRRRSRGCSTLSTSRGNKALLEALLPQAARPHTIGAGAFGIGPIDNQNKSI